MEYKQGAYRQYIDPPYTVKIEFSRGCNLSCKFCPIDVLKDYSIDKKFLKPDMCEIIAEQVSIVKSDGRIELTMRGEPTLNPYVLENVSILRRILPNMQISMFTNGVVFFKNPGLMYELIYAGINILNIDCYNGTYDRFYDLVEDTISDAEDIELRDFREFSAYKRHHNGNRFKIINLVPDIQEGQVDVRQIHNNAGNVNPQYLANLPGYKVKILPMEENCARPYRELVITWNGNVVICCHDWQSESVLGNLADTNLDDIWWGKKHLSILRSLHDKDRTGVPCNKCDYSGGYRLGLLHNPFEER